jgi:hypothetical protein
LLSERQQAGVSPDLEQFCRFAPPEVFSVAARPQQSGRAMSYRIQVHPEAGSLLRTLAPHVVLRLGHTLAELAETVSFGDGRDGDEVRIDDCVMQFAFDHTERLLRVVRVEQLLPRAAFA